MSAKFPVSFKCVVCGKPMTTEVMGIAPRTDEKCYDCEVYMHLHTGKIYAYYFVHNDYSIYYDLYVISPEGRVIDPIASQYKKGKILFGYKEVSAIDNIMFVINDPLFDTLTDRDKEILLRMAQERNL